MKWYVLGRYINVIKHACDKSESTGFRIYVIYVSTATVKYYRDGGKF